MPGTGCVGGGDGIDEGGGLFKVLGDGGGQLGLLTGAWADESSPVVSQPVATSAIRASSAKIDFIH